MMKKTKTEREKARKKQIIANYKKKLRGEAAETLKEKKKRKVGKYVSKKQKQINLSDDFEQNMNLKLGENASKSKRKEKDLTNVGTSQWYKNLSEKDKKRIKKNSKITPIKIVRG